MRSRPGLVRLEVATRSWRRNLAGLQQVSSSTTCFWRRKGGIGHLVSRHQFDVATSFLLPYGNWCRDPIFEFATWAILAGQKGGRDLDFWRRDLEISL